jgi:hypothetical protein
MPKVQGKDLHRRGNNSEPTSLVDARLISRQLLLVQ